MAGHPAKHRIPDSGDIYKYASQSSAAIAVAVAAAVRMHTEQMMAATMKHAARHSPWPVDGETKAKAQKIVALRSTWVSSHS